MLDSFSRTRLLFGKEAMEKIKNARILILGLGGAGSSAAEALARCGVEEFTLVDGGILSKKNSEYCLLSDINQVGESKVSVTKKCLEEINPNVIVNIIDDFYDTELNEKIDFSVFNLILDTVNDFNVKKSLIINANNINIPIISCFGMKNIYDPSLLEITDLFKITEIKDADILKKELKQYNIKKLKLVFSKEKPSEKDIFSLVPSAAGLVLAGEAAMILSGKKEY
jgi:tRNA A37 threonylcarbamoyladenosine dehydratase